MLNRVPDHPWWPSFAIRTTKRILSSVPSPSVPCQVPDRSLACTPASESRRIAQTESRISRVYLGLQGCCRLGNAMRFLVLLLVLMAATGTLFAQGAPVLEL